MCIHTRGLVLECKNASGCHNAITVNHFVIKSKEIKAVRLAGDGLNADRATRRDGDVHCGIADTLDSFHVLKHGIQHSIAVALGGCGGANTVLHQKICGGSCEPVNIVGGSVRAKLRGGGLPQKLRKGHFGARHSSFERVQFFPLLAASVGIALHGAAGQILPEHSKQMQRLIMHSCKIAVLRLACRVVLAIAVDPIGQDRRFFRVCIDCDCQRRCVCRRFAGCGKEIDIDCLLRQCFRRERVSLIAAGQQRLILCPAFRVADIPAFLHVLRFGTGRTKPAGERTGIERALHSDSICRQNRLEQIEVAETGNEGIKRRHRAVLAGIIADRVPVCHCDRGSILFGIGYAVQQQLPIGKKRRLRLCQRQRKNRARIGHKIRCIDRLGRGAAGRFAWRRSCAAAERGGQKKRKEQSYRASYCSHRFSLLILSDSI